VTLRDEAKKDERKWKYEGGLSRTCASGWRMPAAT
jgi:hypothetical protein